MSDLPLPVETFSCDPAHADGHADGSPADGGSEECVVDALPVEDEPCRGLNDDFLAKPCPTDYADPLGLGASCSPLGRQGGDDEFDDPFGFGDVDVPEEGEEGAVVAPVAAEGVYDPFNADEIPTDLRPRLQQPAAQRMMLARGLIPLRPRDLVIALYALYGDTDPGVAAAAKNALAELPRNIWENLVKETIPQKILHWVATRYADDIEFRPVVEQVVINPHAAGRTVFWIARHADDGLCAMVAANERRLLQEPNLVGALADNPRAGLASVSRAVEFISRNKLLSTLEQEELLNRATRARIESHAEQLVEGTADENDGLLGEDENGEPIFASFLLEDNFGMKSAAEMSEFGEDEDGEGGLLEADAFSEQTKKKMRLAQALRKMSVGHRIKLALVGNREVRGLLIADKVKQVSAAVIRNQRITKFEVERLVANKATPLELVTEVTRQRNLTKHYSIRKYLAIHPKVAFQTAVTYLQGLMFEDIKKIARSRSVPNGVRSAARSRVDKEERKKAAASGKGGKK